MGLTTIKYKQTEVGLIPMDWDCVKMGDVGKTIIGLTYSPKNIADYGTLVLRSANIQSNQLAYENNVFVDMDLPQRVIVKEDDILICVRNGSKKLIGKCALIDKKAQGFAFGAFMSIYRSEFSKYIYYSFQSNIIKRQIDETLGATINQLTNHDLFEFKIPLPKKPEQKAIAKVLSNTDALIQALEKKIAKKNHIKIGMMQKLLSPKEDWEVKTLGEVGEIITGGTPPTTIKSYWGGKIPWVTPTDIRAEKNIKSSEREITKEGLGVIRKLPPDTLLVTCIASIGKNAILRKAGACNQQINAIVPNDSNNVDFLYYLIENNASYIKGKAGITATLLISKKDFSEITFAFPKSKIEQNQIAKILSDIDLELELLKQKLSKYQLAKQGMMQKLLTGKIRLV